MAKKQDVGALIRKEVERVTGAKPGDSAYELWCVLLAASQVGVNAKRIAKLIGSPREEVASLLEMGRKNGLFTRTRIVAEDWWAKDGSGGIGFNIDIAVGLGWFERVNP